MEQKSQDQKSPKPATAPAAEKKWENTVNDAEYEKFAAMVQKRQQL
jgi:hypothetical protein